MSGGVSGGSVRSANGGSGQPNGATTAPNGGASTRGIVRAASGITKPEADVWYLNEDGDTATGLIALDGGATVAGNPLALDPAGGNALTWGVDGLYAPTVTVPPDAVTSVNGETGVVVLDAADVGALDQATADGLYAALGHTHPSEESGPWRFQDTAGGTPGAGYLRTSSGALIGATQLIISRTTQDGYDIPPPGWGVVAGDTIYVQDRDDSTKWVRYTALEPLVRYPTYATGLVVESGHAGAVIVNGQIVQVSFSLAGGGGGTTVVNSVNGETGVVVLDAADVGALTQTAADARYLQLSNRAHDHTTADGSGVLSNDEHDGYSQYANLGADPAVPTTNKIRLYSKDNGSGVATLYYRTEDGTVYELPTLTSGGNGSGAPANATYITTGSEAKLSAERVLGTAVIMSGVLSGRPAFGTAGRLYLATDNDLVYRDTGSAWETFATRAATGGGVTSVDGQTGVVDLSATYVNVTGDTITGTLTMSSAQINGQAAGAANVTFLSKVGTESQPRWTVRGDGQHSWGAGGSSAADTSLRRSAANELRVADSLLVDVAVKVGTTATAAAAGGLRLPNATAVGWKNAGGSADLSVSMNASDQLALTVGAGSLTTSATAGSSGAVPSQVQGYLTVVLNGTARKLPYFAV